MDTWILATWRISRVRYKRGSEINMKFLEDAINQYNRSIIDREIIECYEDGFFTKYVEKVEVNTGIEYVFFKINKQEFVNHMLDIYGNEDFIIKHFKNFSNYIYIVALNYKSVLNNELEYIKLYEDEVEAKNDLIIICLFLYI